MRAIALVLLLSSLTAGIATAASDQDICAERQGDKSIAACTRLITSGRLDASDQSTMYALRGSIYRNSGDYDRAIADFTRTIELSEKSASNDAIAAAYVARASVYSLKGQTDAALADYRTAFKRNPRNEQAASNIQRIEATLPQVKPAIAAPKAAQPIGTPATSAVIDGNLRWVVIAAFVGLAIFFVLHLRPGKPQSNTAVQRSVSQPLSAPSAAISIRTAEVAATQQAISKKTRVGIGGWLILPAVGTLVSSIYVLSGTYEAVQGAIPLINNAARYKPIFTASLIGEVAADLLLSLGWVCAVILLVMKRAEWPKLFASLLAASVIFAAANLVFLSQFGVKVSDAQLSSIARNVVVALIWSVYVLSSRRVRNTFVSRASLWNRAAGEPIIVGGVLMLCASIACWALFVAVSHQPNADFVSCLFQESSECLTLRNQVIATFKATNRGASPVPIYYPILSWISLSIIAMGIGVANLGRRQ